MDFFEAMKALKEGNKVRITTWPKEHWLGLRADKHTFCGEEKIEYTPLIQTGGMYQMPVSVVSLLRCDWELWQDESAVKQVEQRIKIRRSKDISFEKAY